MLLLLLLLSLDYGSAGRHNCATEPLVVRFDGRPDRRRRPASRRNGDLHDVIGFGALDLMDGAG